MGSARRPGRRKFFLAVAGCACTLLASCGGSPGSAETRPTVAKGSTLVALKDGTVTVVVPAVPTNLNPHTVEGDAASTRMISALTDPQVFKVDPSVNPELDTDFVLSAEVVSVNPQTVLYQLNPKAVWSDGVRIGSKDFVYNWEEQAGSDSLAPPIVGGYDAATTLGYRDIESITPSVSGDGVRVVFSTPYADWADLFDDLIAEHVANVIGWSSGYGSPSSLAFVSGGPYEVDSWIPGSQIVLVRNTRWWGTRGRVAKIVVDAAAVTTGPSDQLTAGPGQVIYTSDFDQQILNQVSSSPSEKSNLSLGTTMLQLVFDLRSANDQSADLRQAIALDLNRKQMVSELVQPLDPNVEVDDDFLATNAQHAYTHDGALYDTPDPQQAAVLLQQAGMTMGTRGTWMSGGVPVVLDLRWASGDPWSDLVAPAIQAALVQAGFGVKANPVDDRQLGETSLADSDWDLALVPVVSSPYPGQMAVDYSQAQAVTGQGESGDWSGFDAPEVDAQFQEAALQLNPARAATIYRQIDQLLWQAMPSIPLFAEPALLVSNAGVSGVQAAVWGSGPLWKATGWALMGVAPKHQG